MLFSRLLGINHLTQTGTLLRAKILLLNLTVIQKHLMESRTRMNSQKVLTARYVNTRG